MFQQTSHKFILIDVQSKVARRESAIYTKIRDIMTDVSFQISFYLKIQTTFLLQNFAILEKKRSRML